MPSRPNGMAALTVEVITSWMLWVREMVNEKRKLGKVGNYTWHHCIENSNGVPFFFPQKSGS